MKYVSTNIFTDFQFHDAEFRLEQYQNQTLILSAEHLNIHKHTEQNPSDTDMEIGVARITFSGFRALSFNPGRFWKTDENGESYTDESEMVFDGVKAEEKLLNELRVGVAVYEFGTLENGNRYFDGTGNEVWFQAQFMFETATVEWDAYKKPSWYEEQSS